MHTVMIGKAVSAGDPRNLVCLVLAGIAVPGPVLYYEKDYI